MQKRILGLDPGLASLGFGAIVAQENKDSQTSAYVSTHVSTIDFGIIQTRSSQELGDRLCTIYEDLHALINQIKPDLVAAEKLFFYRMGNTILVAQARGVLILVLAQHKLPLVEYTPAQIKQALTGYGNAEKHEVQAAVARELNLTEIPRPDDAADGLAVALTAWFDRGV